MRGSNKGIRRSDRLLLVLAILFCLAGQFGRQLWTPDEPRVAAVATSMTQSHDWIVPDFAGLPFIEKPPLGFAIYSLSETLFGSAIGRVNAMRLANAGLALGMLWLIFALGRRLFGRETGIRAGVILGTMLGFIANSHWLRIDLALGFFVLLAIYAFAECCLGRRWQMAWLAGAATGGAFLSKGIVGPGVIFLAWLPLILHSWRAAEQGPDKRRLLGSQLAALAGFILPAGGWMLALRLHANGASLWHTWLWTNQIGRATGNTPKGHMHPHAHFYYLAQTLQYTFPWLVLPFVWLWQWLRRRERGVEAGLLASWVLGTLLILSIAAGKRSIYMFPVVPGLALMAARYAEVSSRGLRLWARGLLSINGVIALALALLPFYASRINTTHLPASALAAMRDFGWHNLLGLGLAAASLAALWSLRKMDHYRLTATAGALILATVFFQVMPLLSSTKNMRASVEAFANTVPQYARQHVGSVNMKETERGMLEFYAHWSIPPVDDAASVKRILAGRDAQMYSLIVDRDNAQDTPTALLGVPDSQYCILSQAQPRSDDPHSALYWIAGAQTDLCSQVTAAKARHKQS